jgi:hypothetical protein
MIAGILPSCRLLPRFPVSDDPNRRRPPSGCRLGRLREFVIACGSRRVALRSRSIKRNGRPASYDWPSVSVIRFPRPCQSRCRARKESDSPASFPRLEFWWILSLISVNLSHLTGLPSLFSRSSWGLRDSCQVTDPGLAVWMRKVSSESAADLRARGSVLVEQI